MNEKYNKKGRSYNMSRIKSKNTAPEILVRKYLFKNGFRYRIHYQKLPGKPDIVLPKYNTVIFVNGCFWHGHEGCKYFVLPKTRVDWWRDKINRNRERDKINKGELKKLGYKTITIFECELKKGNGLEALNKIVKQIKNG